jgi:WD40 repeat protein
LAYAISGLEHADTSVGRLFALEALSKGPPAIVMKHPLLSATDFSPDGRWLAVGSYKGVKLFERNGADPITLSDIWPKGVPLNRHPAFSPDGELLVWQDPNVIKVWSISKRKQVRSFPVEGHTNIGKRLDRVFFSTNVSGDWSVTRIRSWKFDEREPELIGDYNFEGIIGWIIDSKAQWVAYPKGNKIWLRTLQGSGSVDRIIGDHKSSVQSINFHPSENILASLDSAGEIRFWRFEQNLVSPEKLIIAGRGSDGSLFFDGTGTSLVTLFPKENVVRVWDLKNHVGAEQFSVQRTHIGKPTRAHFDAAHRWFAVSWTETLALHSLGHSYPFIYIGEGELGAGSVRFTPDGNSMVTELFDGGVRFWPVNAGLQTPVIDGWKPRGAITSMDLAGTSVVLGTFYDGVILLSAQDGSKRSLKGITGDSVECVAISKDGRFVAAANYQTPKDTLGIQIWDVESDKAWVLEKSKGIPIYFLKFSSDGTLFSGDLSGNLYQWNLQEGHQKLIGKGIGIVSRIAVSKDGRYVAAATLTAKKWDEIGLAKSQVAIYDQKTQTSRSITSHGNRVCSVAFDPPAKILVTGDLDGIVRVGPVTGETPHILMGHETLIGDVAVDPSGRWIGSAESEKPIVRLWPMPQGKPFQTLPHNEFLDRLKALTNIRIIADHNSTSGYRVDYGPFPGWEKVPEW